MNMKMTILLRRADRWLRLAAIGACIWVLQTAAAQAIPLSEGLQGYWQFENNGADSSGHGRDVVLAGGAGFGPGLFGSALALNGVQGSFAARPINDPVFDFGPSDFTIQVWAKFSSVGREQTLIEKFSGINGPGWTFTTPPEVSQQFIRFATSPFDFDSSTIAFPTNIWQQFIVRRSQDTYGIFYDDNLVATLTNATPFPPSPNPLLIGARDLADGRNFTVDGSIDEVAIWTRALSNEEISSLWNGGTGQQITVPEPATFTLLAPVLLLFAAVGRLRRR